MSTRSERSGGTAKAERCDGLGLRPLGRSTLVEEPESLEADIAGGKIPVHSWLCQKTPPLVWGLTAVTSATPGART
jgi:hypothetical protein